MKLSGAEYDIMDCVWDLQRAVTSADILRELGAARGWKQPTVLTFLSRLVEKGLLATEKNGKVRSYTAAVSREAYKSAETRVFLARLSRQRLRKMSGCRRSAACLYSAAFCRVSCPPSGWRVRRQ